MTDEFGFSKPIILNAPNGSVTTDMLSDGAVTNGKVAADAGIELSKIKDLPRTLKGKLTKDGSDRMEGPLDMGNQVIKNLLLPTEDHHGANKKYVDDLIVGGGLGFTPVNKAGDIMTGFLTLPADPIADLQAATKQYVDNKLSGLNSGGDTFKGGNNTFTGSNTFTNPVQLNDGFVAGGDSLLSGSLQVSGSVSITGSTIFTSGSITQLGRHPLTNLDAATKEYVDDQINNVHPGDVFLDGSNTFTGTNLFKGSFNIDPSCTFQVSSQANFSGLINGSDGLTVAGSVSLSDSSSVTNINGSEINLNADTTILSGKGLVLGKDPVNSNEAATKNYVDSTLAARFSISVSIVESLSHLPLDPIDQQMAYVESIAGLYIFDGTDGFWLPFHLSFFPDWVVISDTQIAVNVMGNDLPTLVTATPADTTRFYLYRRSDSEIDLSITPPDFYNGIPGIIQSDGSLNFVKPYIGSVVSNGSALVKEQKVGTQVSRLETSVLSSPVANNTGFSGQTLTGYLPETTNNGILMARLIVPVGTGPDLELYTRTPGSSVSLGKLCAGHWSSSSAAETGSYSQFTVTTNDSKTFEYRFSRVMTSVCTFYFLGYQEII